MDLIQATLAFTEHFFATEFSGHDYYHTLRVFHTATRIARAEQADLELVQLAALLHDVDDRKLSPETCREQTNARSFLEGQQVAPERIEAILKIIRQVSYAGEDSVTPDTAEGKCVQDADRLDAIGAVGIGRAFAYGGHHNRPMHDPAVPPKTHMTKEEYYNSNSTTINHFYEKLLRLKDKLSTPTAKAIAQERHAYMEGFLAQFLAEWEGNK